MAKAKGFEAGGEIDLICTRCKLLLAHTVIAAVSGVPARVKCNTCGSERKYKAPSRAERSGDAVRRRGTGPETPAKPRRNATALWEHTMAQAGLAETPARPYSMRLRFDKGDIVSHVKFGPGFVMETVGSDKIKVCFREGEKLLIHGRG